MAMSQSPNLEMPFILPAQAQKHVTHNLAIEILDALVQLSVTELHAVEPPADPVDGQVVGVGNGATGGFAGKEGKLAYFTNGGWIFVSPRDGFTAWVQAEQKVCVYQNGAWRNLPAAGIAKVDGLGVNADWNEANRVVVSSPATLLTHQGKGHQLKINKAAAPDTASLLFQTDFKGHAEMGLSGDNAYSVKVSPDGAAWSKALSINAEDATVEMGRARIGALSGDAVQAAPQDTTPGRLMRADWGYGPGNLLGTVRQSGGMPTGAVIESGENANGNYVRFADGTQIMTMRNVSNSVSIGANQSKSGVWPFPASATQILHTFASVRTYGSETYVRLAAESLNVSAAAIDTGAAWAIYAKTAAPAVRVDVTILSRWF